MNKDKRSNIRDKTNNIGKPLLYYVFYSAAIILILIGVVLLWLDQRSPSTNKSLVIISVALLPVAILFIYLATRILQIGVRMDHIKNTIVQRTMFITHQIAIENIIAYQIKEIIIETPKGAQYKQVIMNLSLKECDSNFLNYTLLIGQGDLRQNKQQIDYINASMLAYYPKIKMINSSLDSYTITAKLFSQLKYHRKIIIVLDGRSVFSRIDIASEIICYNEETSELLHVKISNIEQRSYRNHLVVNGEHELHGNKLSIDNFLSLRSFARGYDYNQYIIELIKNN